MANSGDVVLTLAQVKTDGRHRGADVKESSISDSRYNALRILASHPDRNFDSIPWLLGFDPALEQAYNASYAVWRRNGIHVMAAASIFSMLFHVLTGNLSDSRPGVWQSPDGRPCGFSLLVITSVVVLTVGLELMMLVRPESHLDLHRVLCCVGPVVYVTVSVVGIYFKVAYSPTVHDGGIREFVGAEQEWIASAGPIGIAVLLVLPAWVNGIGTLCTQLVVAVGPAVDYKPDFWVLGVTTTGTCVNVVVLYALDYAFRRAFISKMQIVRLGEEIHAHEQKQLSDHHETQRLLRETENAAALKLNSVKAEADRIAFQTINHTVKRTFLNDLEWYEFIEHKVIPKFDTDPAAAKEYMKKTLAALVSSANEGINNCKATIVQREIASGKYITTPTACSLRELLYAAYGIKPRVSINVHEDVPEVVMLDTTLLKMIISNAVSNAEMHGEARGPVDISVLLNTSGELQLSVVNKAGPKHEENKLLQAHGSSHLLASTKAAGVGSIDSTFLGCSEIQRAVDLMGATASLFFTAIVTFTLTMTMIAAPNKHDAMQLPEGTVLICVDDDAISRMQYTSFVTKMKLGPIDTERSQVLGKTYAEAAGLADTVMACYADFGHQLLCIFDQNLDYAEAR